MSILWRVERYLQASGTSPTRFGREACRDPRLVHDLRNGRQPGGRMAARIVAYIEHVR